MPREMTLHPSALSLFVWYRHQLEERRRPGTGDLSEIRDWAGKADGQTVRIATIIQLLWEAVGETSVYPEGKVPPDPNEVSPEAMARGILYMDYFCEHAKAAHAMMGEETEERAELKRMRHLHAYIRDYGADEISLATVKQSMRKTVMFRSSTGRDLVRETMDALGHFGWLRLLADEAGGPGRKSRVYLVNPRLLAGDLM